MGDQQTTRWLTLLLTLAFASLGFAQVEKSSIRGTIRDGQGHAVPGALVQVEDGQTGLTRIVTCDDAGFYSVPALPVGTYHLSVSARGFNRLEFSDLEQTVGLQRTLDGKLQVASARESVDVFASPAALDRSSDSLETSFERKQISELPLNGRSWSTLTALTSGAVDAGGSNQRSVRFAGRGLDDNDFSFDGVDASNIVNQAQPAFVRLAIPTDSIQEFRAQTALFTADSGQTPGGQLTVVSGAGSNAWHGRAFDFLRNSVLDAREPIDAINPHKPTFRLNQFGGSLSGPIQKNKTFFYVTYEGLRQMLDQTLLGFVPSDTLRARVLTNSPALIPLLNAYPQGQSAVNGNIAGRVSTGKQIDHENSAMIRLDHRFTAETTSFLRFNMDEAVSSVPLGSGGQYLDSTQHVSSRPVNGVLDVLHVASPHLLFDSKIGFNRGTNVSANLTPSSLPYSISVPGLTALANNQTKTAVANSYSWIEDVSYQWGRHMLHFGGQGRRIQLNQGNSASGSISYSSIANFTSNLVNAASYASALPVNGLRKTEWFAYVEDEVKLAPTLTLNAGLRYEFYNRFHEVLDRAVPFDFRTCGPAGFCAPGAQFSRPNTLDFDPRVAIAWAPSKLSGNTVLRAGFGVYHGDGQLDDQNLPIANEVRRYSLSAISTHSLAFPIDPYLANAAGIVSPREMDRLRKDMYVSQWGASWQQALPARLVNTVSYIGSKGTHLLTTSYVNVLDASTHSRPNPLFGQVEYRGNNNDSSFEALQDSLQRSFRNGLSTSLNYLYSHEIDDGALGGGDADFPGIVGCGRCERASGDFDARHVFTANAIYELPFGRGHRYLRGSGLLPKIVGSWQVTSILSARSGLPVNVTLARSAATVPDGNTVNQRPDLVAGASLLPPTGQAISNWINPAAFAVPHAGSFGNAPRNALRAPSIWQSDLGIGRNFSLTERFHAQFRTEIFNLFNHPQYGAPVADFSSPNFGRILSTVNVGPVGTGTPRQIQFMLKAEF